MNGLLLVGGAGAVGALSRHVLDIGLRRRFPDGQSIGILVANVVGSFVLGWFTGLTVDRLDRTVNPDARLAIAVGFCGGLTTFSTFMAELAEEIEGGRRATALRWGAVMMGSGLVAAGLGVMVGSFVVSIEERRRLLQARGLHRADLDPDPFVQFQRWFDEAVEVGLHEPEAMVVSSVGEDEMPSSRYVLLRGLDHGFVFFTDRDSRKGRELDSRPQGAICFPWHLLSRQFRVNGPVGAGQRRRE